MVQSEQRQGHPDRGCCSSADLENREAHEADAQDHFQVHQIPRGDLDLAVPMLAEVYDSLGGSGMLGQEIRLLLNLGGEGIGPD